MNTRPRPERDFGRGAPEHPPTTTTHSLALDYVYCQVDVLCTLLACLWHDADQLSRRHVDAAHAAHALDCDFAARLAHRLAATLESKVA